MKLRIQGVMGKRKTGTLTILALAGSVLVACSPEAKAQQAAQVDGQEPVRAATGSAETPIRTMAECRVLAEKAEKIACMTTARDALRAENAAQLAAVAEILAGLEQENAELRTTIEGLTKGLDIAEALQAEREQQER